MQIEQLKLLRIEDFHAAAQKGETLEGRLHKGYAIEVKAAGDPTARTVSIRISTKNRDRDSDTVEPKGWQLLNYRKNPVVLWGHDYWNPPVGKDIGITVDELGLMGLAQFATKDEYAFADTVYLLVVGGYLSAASVGFRSLKWVYNEAEHGVDFLEQELLEYSIVPVPANPEALVGAKSAGIDLLPLKDWAEKTLDLCSGGEPHMLVPRKSVERAMKLLENERTVLWVPAGFSKSAAETYAKDHGATLILAEPTKTDGDPTLPPPADTTTPATPPAGDPVVPPAGADPAPAPKAPEAGSGVDEGDAEVVLELTTDEEPEETLSFDREDFVQALGESVDAAVSTKLTHLTGRLD